MMISCSEAKTDAKKLEGKWNVVEVKGEKILKEGLPYMEFDMAQNKLHGNAGCNMFNTTITLDANDVSSITIAPGAATMMACPDMATEDAIMKAMGDVKAVKAGNSESEMTLVDQDGNVLLVLSKN
ncbi:META domain-containing protein [Parabacteroides sp. AM58-2XD]|nr:META domain-containing protein [Parabacteroides sp. AM58-2XD]